MPIPFLPRAGFLILLAHFSYEILLVWVSAVMVSAILPCCHGILNQTKPYKILIAI